MLQIQDAKALGWPQNEAKQLSTSSTKKRASLDCAPSFTADAIAALPNNLINFLTIDNLAPLVAGRALAASLQAGFNVGRAIVQLVAVSDDTLLAAAELFLVLFDEALNRQQAIATATLFPSVILTRPPQQRHQHQARARRAQMLQHARTRLALETTTSPPAPVPGLCQTALALRW